LHSRTTILQQVVHFAVAQKITDAVSFLLRLNKSVYLVNGAVESN
jgi:hypothetical protein